MIQTTQYIVRVSNNSLSQHYGIYSTTENFERANVDFEEACITWNNVEVIEEIVIKNILREKKG